MTISKNILQTGIKVAFIDNDGKRVDGITVDQANQIAANNPNTRFYFQNGDGLEQELSIDEVNQLLATDLLPTAPDCSTGPQVCGPPLVRFFGGGGTGASANAIISPISSSIIAFDIIDSGFGFFDSPIAELIDPCGKGSGAKLQVNLEADTEDTSNVEDEISTIDATIGSVPTPQTATATATGSVAASTTQAQNETSTIVRNRCEEPRRLFEKTMLRRLRRSKKIKNITIIAPGDGYLSRPDGSLGGNGNVWKEPDEGFVRTKCGGYYVVQPYRPIRVEAGDTYYPPNDAPRTLTEPEVITLPLVPVSTPTSDTIGPSYPVVLVIDEIVVLDPGFGYRPGDQLIIDPSNGAVADLIVNDRGEIEKVNITQPGIGFLDLPKVRTNSPTGFNATFSTILRPIRIDTSIPIEDQLGDTLSQDKLISVIDCVGKIPPRQISRVPR